MIKLFRKTYLTRPISVISISTLLFQLVYPSLGYALTSGPSQPEVQSFEPVSTTQMVNPFTGDFTYNIPLLDVGGYPVNIAYHAGIGMDQEASWVGLGWNINPGVINRNMRGIPDDFNGDEIEKKTKMKQQVYVGVDPRVKNVIEKKDELIGFDANTGSSFASTSANFADQMTYNIYYNNYKGIGYSLFTNLPKNENSDMEFQVGIGLGFDSQEGFSVAPSIAYNRKHKDNEEKKKKILYNVSASMGYSSREGLTNIGVGLGVSKSKKTTEELYGNPDCDLSTYSVTETRKNGLGKQSAYSFQSQSYTPLSTPNTFSYNYNIKFKFFRDATATTNPKAQRNIKISANVGINGIHNVTSIYKGYGFLNDYLANDDALTDVNEEGNVFFSKFTNNLRPSMNTYDILGQSGQGTGGSYKPFKNYLAILSAPSMRKLSISKVGLPVEIGITQPKPAVKKYNYINPSASTDIYEVSYGKSVKIGLDPTLGFVWGSSGLWNDKGNESFDNLNYQIKKDVINSLNEKVFYKNASEKTVYDQQYMSDLGGNHALKFKVNATASPDIRDNQHLLPIFQLSNNTELTIPTNGIEKVGRVKRSEVISHLNAYEAVNYGVEKNIYSCTYNSSTKLIDKTSIGRNEGFRRWNHISEIITTSSEGVRYVYGLPAYNTLQYENQFNVGEKNANIDYYKHGIVGYNSTDNSMGNIKGVNHYYHSEKMPPYVHSWMLTAVLSADYVDVTGDGPTNDDLGSYTKFNYNNITLQGGNNYQPYKWRFPYQEMKGNFGRGLKSDELDDKATLVEGEKEIWYLQSIETKTHIAIFHTSSRLDGFEANQNGGLGNSSLHKLDKIELFNIVDFYQYPTTRIAIKTVNFEYSYDLCKFIPNNNGTVANITHPLNSYNSNYTGDINANKGKLTLHKIWFGNGSSQKGSLSPYIFEYNSDNNFEYASRSMDRWGNYKPWNYHNQLTNSYSGSDNELVSNAEFPYVPQKNISTTEVNNWASAWCLTDIRLPSGGKFKVEYEADDYAFVQNRKSMQMAKVAGFIPDINASISNINSWNQLYDYDFTGIEDIQNLFNVNKYLLFDWPDNVVNDQDVFDGMKSVYGSFYVTLNRNQKPLGYNAKKEHIQVYMDVELDGNNKPIVGTKIINSVKYGYLLIKPTFMGDKDNNQSNDDIHPITKQALQFTRENVSHIAFPGSNCKRGDIDALAIAGNAISFIPEFIKTLIGFDTYHVKNGYGCLVDLNNSFVKINNPNGFKKGGGHRVKRITMNDAWDEMTNDIENSLITGQEYDYTVYDEVQKKIVSSGVASYEPLVGGDENPWRERIQFDDGSFTIEEKNLFAPNNFRFEEGPIGESFFPGALVGYSKVRIKNIKPVSTNPNQLKKHGTGSVVYSFYTNKDFPYFTDRTNLDVYIRKNLALGLLGYSKQKATASQGFLIETNDMHGKLKSLKNYGEYDENRVISGQEYEYFVENDKAPELKLLNEVSTIDKAGQKSQNKTIGYEVELFSNASKREDNVISGTAQVNLHLVMPNSGLPPLLPLLSVIPQIAYSRSVVQQATITKVISRFGILKKITAIHEDARLSTENICWDEETGEVVLTRTENEFGDWDYQLSKPAHWIETGMGPAYQNIGVELLLATTGTMNPGEVIVSSLDGFGATQVADIEELLCPGDELIASMYLSHNFGTTIANTDGTEKYWVLSVGNGKANLIDKFGNPIAHDSKPYFFKIYRSGHKNMLTSPAEIILTQSDPTSNSNWSQSSIISDVISGSALVYSDKWQIYYQKAMKARVNCELDQEPFYEEMESTNPVYMISMPPGKKTDLINSTNWPEYNVCGNKSYYSPGNFANPFLLGVRGNWRPSYSMVYYDRTNADAERTQVWNSGDPNKIDIRTAGLIQNYVPFYKTVSGIWTPEWTPGNTITDKWLWKNHASMIAPNGEEVENEDAMNIYSSALYGYQKTLATAVCTNSKYQDMMFDGFEEYDEGFFTIDCAPGNALNLQYFPASMPFTSFYNPFEICNNIWHWPLWKALANGNGRISTKEAHTGKQSLVAVVPYTPGDDGMNPELPSFSIILENNNALTGINNISGGKFYLSKNDFIPVFYPENSGNVESYFLLSYWVKGNGLVKIKDLNGNILQFDQIGNDIIIDGWKRIEGKLHLPAGAALNEIAFYNYNSAYPNTSILNYPPGVSVIQSVYFDDIRIFPFNGNMNSYVFNKVNKRLMATLSANNFATFYEYDEEGNLIRTKVETERGIMTVQENRSSLRKK